MAVRTTVDIPDSLYRELKAKAASQGRSVKELILRGVEREMRDTVPKKGRVRLPLIRGKETRKLDLTNAQIDKILFG
jgi:hypothetical protein